MLEAVFGPIFQIAIIAIDIYILFLVVNAVLSWLVAFNVINTSNQFIRMVGDFLYRVTEPALGPIRRRMPDLGGVDISPIILILILYLIQMWLTNIVISMSMPG